MLRERVSGSEAHLTSGATMRRSADVRARRDVAVPSRRMGARTSVPARLVRAPRAAGAGHLSRATTFVCTLSAARRAPDAAPRARSVTPQMQESLDERVLQRAHAGHAGAAGRSGAQRGVAPSQTARAGSGPQRPGAKVGLIQIYVAVSCARGPAASVREGRARARAGSSYTCGAVA